MEFRKGRGSDDAEAIAALIWDTDPEMCEFVFGSHAEWVRNGAREWRQEFGLHDHRSGIVAMDGDRPVGVSIAFPESEMTQRYAATIARYEAATGERMATVGWLFPVLPPGSLYVFNLSVAPDHRGKGIGARLLAQTLSNAGERGLTSIHLDVATTAPSVQFYKRQGFTELTKTELLDPPTRIPPHVRMQKTIV